ncbi:hypothetical protein ACFCZT_25820 [Streptomyces sp. NPDC056230]|uniref:hypothetical protein n=1 Tax=Streptomyces sp. NPDC056230 TaxID=3345754 RepID=UPI0035DD411E
MDPAITAALISTPVALFAAAAAYGAGRVQGRATYQGPVDAVRRQHQRDAYAALLGTANSYVRQTNWGECSRQACDRLGICYPPRERREEADRQACRVRAEVPIEPLRLAAAVVELEGPEQIAAIAGRIENAAHSVHVRALWGEAPHTFFDILDGNPAPDDDHNHHLDLLNAVHAFTEAARAHLNDSQTPRWR